MLSSLGGGWVGHQGVPRATLMACPFYLNPVGNLLVNWNFNAMLSELVEGVGVGFGPRRAAALASANVSWQWALVPFPGKVVVLI